MSRAPPPVPAAYLADPQAYAQASEGLQGSTSHLAAAAAAHRAPPLPPPGSPTAADVAASARSGAPAPLPRAPRKQTDLNDLSAPPSHATTLLFNNPVTRQCGRARRGCNECRKSSHACERALVCAVAVALLWLTSLGLCQAIVHYFIIVPDVNMVIAMAEFSLDSTEYQKQAYDACATRLLHDCNLTIHQGMHDAQQLVQQQQQSNAQAIAQLRAQDATCAIELANGVSTVNYIQSEHNVDPMADYSTAEAPTDPRCPLVVELLKGQKGGMLALGAAARYSADASQQAEQALVSFDARAEYDRQYWQNKSAQYGLVTNGTLRSLVNDTGAYFAQMDQAYNQYMACVSPNNTYAGEECDEQSVLYKYAQMQQEAKDRFDSTKQQALQWAQQANQTITQMAQFYNALKSNGGLLAAFEVLLNFNGQSLEGLGFNAIGDMSLGGFSLGQLSTLNVDQLMQEYAAETQAYLASMANEQANAAQATARLLLEQANLPNSHPFGSYSPPPVNTSTQREQVGNLTAPFVASMSAALTGTAALGGSALDYLQSNDTRSPSLGDAQNSTTELLASLQTRVFGFFVYAGFDAQEYADSYDRLISLCLTFDYAFRAAYTIQLILKYWRVSAIDTPPADVRTDLMQDKGLAVDTRSPLAKLGAFIAHPATQVLVFFIFGGLIVSVFLNMYLPLYNNFVHGCVRQDYTGTGSMISQNAFAISYNFASANGDKITTVAVDKLNARREVDCTREVDSSRKQLQQDEKDYDLLFRALQDSQYQSGALASCLDVPALHSDFPGATQAATSGNETVLMNALPGVRCSASTAPLQDATYACATQVCAQQMCFTNVNNDTLKAITWSASCVAEEFFHTTFLTSAMIILVFILINISRIFGMRGLVRMYWRFLTDGRFTYLGTCERDGELRYPSLITVEKYSMRRAIQESLRVRIFYWEARAWGIFLFGMSMNVPWIVVLSVLKDNTRAGSYEDILAIMRAQATGAATAG